VRVAEFCNCHGLARLALVGGRVHTSDDVPQQPPRFLASSVRGPWCAVAPDREAALPAFARAVHQHIGHGGSDLAPSAKARNRAIPEFRAGSERRWRSESGSDYARCGPLAERWKLVRTAWWSR